MDKNEYYNDPDCMEEDEDELNIDWAELITKLLKEWKFIGLVSFLFAVVGVGVALLTPKKYTVSVMLAPEVQGKSGGGSIGGIASMLGLGSASIGSGGDALNISLFPEISASTPFLAQLFDVEVTPYVAPDKIKKGAQPATPTTLYKYITKEDEPKSWFANLKESVFGKAEEIETDTLNLSQFSPKQRLVIQTLQANVGAAVDKKTAITTISVTMDDPWIATTLADTVCQRLQDYVIAYRTQKASEDLAYYEMLAKDARARMVKAQAAYATSVDYDRSVILQSVNTEKDRLRQEAQLASELYSQTEQQVQLAKAKLQEVKPVFAVVQPATMPARPSSASRKNVVLIVTLLGCCLACAWVLFGKDFFFNLKQQIKEKKEGCA